MNNLSDIFKEFVEAVENNDYKAVLEIAEKHDCHDKETEDKRKPIHIAGLKGNLQTVKELLKLGFDVEGVSNLIICASIKSFLVESPGEARDRGCEELL